MRHKSDLFESVSGKFDLVVFNPPYLPSDPSDADDELRKSWDGGENGRVQLVTSSLGSVEHVMQRSSA